MDQNNVKKNLLLVEDERVIGSTCSRILTKEGFNVVLATNGEMAIKLLEKHRFDICLLDVRTPAIDGLQLYNHICRTVPGLSSKVIFMTTDSLTRSRPEFVNNAGCRFLEKPFTTDELITAVKNI